MAAGKLVFLCILGLLEACGAAGAGEEPACVREEGESSCLLMRSASVRSPARSLKADNVSAVGFKTACFKAHLAANPAAVPLSLEAAKSEAFADVKVFHKQVDVSIDWKLPGASKKNRVIGLHIHEGDKATSGDILVGFCGEDPLPEYTGPCAQGKKVREYQVGTKATAEAAEVLLKTKDAKTNFYLNLHTDSSFARTAGLGLIRGQLEVVKCPFR